MMRESVFILTLFSNIIFLATAAPFLFIWIFQDNFIDESIQISDFDRNERSTPRTFILPANPAVALVQERKENDKLMKESIMSCLIKLYDLGYKVYDIDDFTNHEVFVQTLKFQLDKQLMPSGVFDKETKERIQC